MITDLTGTRWQINANPVESELGDIWAYIDFISNGNTYSLFALGEDILQYANEPRVYDEIAYCIDDELNEWEWVGDYATTSVIEITGGNYATNTDFINWLQDNATMLASVGVEIEYDNAIIHAANSNERINLLTANKLAETDILLRATELQSLTVEYNGNTILSTSGTTIRRLKTAGKLLTANIGVVIVARAIVYPKKGDVIAIDTLSGTFLVLNINGSIAEVISRTNYSTNSWPNTSGQTYIGSNPDTRCNSNFYNSLSANVKAAIVDKTFKQDSWYPSTSGDPDYKGRYSTSTNYDISLGNASFGAEITRHCYSISVQDIIDYLGVTTDMGYANSTLNRTNIRKMLNSTSASVWTRSANANNAAQAMIVNTNTGRITTGANSSSYGIRPAFQIDLSKIEWSY